MSQVTSFSRESNPIFSKPITTGVPSFLAKLWELWKPIARKIGDFQARLILTAFYILVIAPFALLIRWRGDPLGIKSHAPRGWLPHTDRPGDAIHRATQQF